MPISLSRHGDLHSFCQVRQKRFSGPDLKTHLLAVRAHRGSLMELTMQRSALRTTADQEA